MTKFDETRQIGSFSFDPQSEVLRDATGQSVQLRPQSMRVLALLVSRRRKLVTKEELMQEVWADTHVTDDSLVQCISEIRKVLGRDDSKLLKTIPKQGYRLETQVNARESRLPSLRLVKILVAAIIVVGLAVPATLFALRPRPEPESAKQSIAVMPFINTSGDESQSYFSEGITDDLITDLSKISELTVIARATTFAYRGEQQDARQISRGLGVRYVLQGSVRRDGQRIRINVQLIDGEDGTNIWAERYDGNYDSVFTLQDQVTSSIVSSLALQLTDDEARRISRPPTENPDAYDLYLRGIRAQGFFNRESNLEAQRLFLRAIDLDPEFASAYARLGQAYSLAIETRWTDDIEGTKRKALDSARKAIELDAELPYAYWSIGRIHTRYYAADYDAAVEAFETAIALNPNFADGYMFLAITYVLNGRVEDSLGLIEKAMRLNPEYPFWYLQTLGMAQYFLGNYQASAESFEKAIERNPAVPWLYHLLIASYGKLEMVDEAEWIAFELEALGQPATVKAILETSFIHDPQYNSDFEDGLRRAGLTEE